MQIILDQRTRRVRTIRSMVRTNFYGFITATVGDPASCQIILLKANEKSHSVLLLHLS